MSPVCCLLSVVASFAVAAPASAAVLGEPSPQAGGTTIYVSAVRGSDRAPATRARPLRTVTAAWARVPTSRTLERPYTIVLLPGRWTAAQTPNYWQSRWGTSRAPVILRAERRGSATLPAVNMFDVRWLVVDGVRFNDRFDLFHCERCQHVLIERSRFDGSQQLLDTVKFNQSSWAFLRGDRISGASMNPLQFVAVQHGAVTGNELAHGGDWCAYVKGGSADLLIAHNRVHDCGTGGLLAGQGSGLQFMVPPFDQYEAYGIVITDNWIWRTEGAGVGVNGAANVAIVNNRLWKTGARSHTVELDYGLRTCDGQPQDPGRKLCQRYLDQGAWGTTRIDDGTNQVRIPNLNVTVAGNVIANPRQQGDELLDIPAQFSGQSQSGSGLGPVRADRGLQIYHNLFAVGSGLPNGTDNCSARDCAVLRLRNTVTGPSNPFRGPAYGDLTLTRHWTPATLHTFDWSGFPPGIA
jgi:hypothetical protein